MIELKYGFLIVILSSLLFQYFKHRNVQNQKFISYLSYFEEMSRVSKEASSDLKFIVGFESVKYSIYKNFTIFDAEDYLKSSLCFNHIDNRHDLQCALFKAKRTNYNLKYYVKNGTLFKEIMKDSRNKVFSERLSGSGVNFARQLAYLKHTDVVLVSNIEKSSLKLLPNNIKVPFVLDGKKKKIGLRKLGAIVYFNENRKAVFDRVGLKSILEDFDLINLDLMQQFSPHCFVIGRFPPVRGAFIDRIANAMKEFSNGLSSVPAGVVIHHQFGLLDNIEAGKYFVKHFIPHVDSIDLGLQELHQLHSLVRKGDLETSMYTSDIETSLNILEDLWKILHSGSFSARAGTRTISRIHLRAHDYHILLANPNSHMFYMNLRYALAKGLMAQLHVRCHRKMAVLKEIIHFYLEDEFFMNRNLTESPIQCWTNGRLFEVCVSPVPTCFELKHPLEDGESTAAAALAAQIKIPT